MSPRPVPHDHDHDPEQTEQTEQTEPAGQAVHAGDTGHAGRDDHADGTGTGTGSSTGTADAAGGGLGTDELALRRLMRDAVSDLAPPSDEALDRLRKAVPARRARKRQAVVGAVAAGVFVAMAIPAVVHVANTSASNDRPSIAGNSETAQGGVDAGKESGASGHTGGGASGHAKGKGKDGRKDRAGGKGKDSGGTSTDRPGTGSTAAASSPVCSAAALGTPVPNVGVKEASGKVYGSFRVTNVSDANCTVDSAGTVQTLAQGAADATRVTVVDHTSGDAATGLPDPSAEPGQLILKPGMAYEVRFAWVPSAQCPATGGGNSGGNPGGDGGTGNGGTESPSPTATPDGQGEQQDTTDSGLSTQLGSDDATDGSVVVEHQAEPGAPSVAATISDACAGTVYKTGVLPAS
jgi:hypothetical protein